MKHLHVAAAVLIFEGRILCLQRNVSSYDYISYKFEFPGGKIEPGETKEEALMRELSEELDISVRISPDDFFMTVHHVYPDFEITMETYLCPVGAPAFTRKEHISHVWAAPEEMKKLDWAAADLPVVESLVKRFQTDRP